MAIPSNREEFANYCLRKLGQPVIKVNVAVEQIDDRIEEALYKFYERHMEAVEEVFILHTITDEDREKGFIQLSNDVVGVVDVFKPNDFAGSYTVEYSAYITDLYNTAYRANFGGLNYYYTMKMNQALVRRFFSPDYSYTYNQITNKVIVSGGLRNADNTQGGLIIRGFRKLHGEETLDDPSNTSIHNIWKNKWLQNYATALIKRQWATNLSKYQSVQLLGGVQMSGENMWNQAEVEIKELEAELELAYEFPPTFIVG